VAGIWGVVKRQNEIPVYASVKIEKYLAMPGAWQFSLFADSGHVQEFKTTFAPGPNSGRVTGAGVGMHWSAPDDWAVSASVATPIGSTPALVGPDVNTSTRFWLQIQKGF
jgi:hemolysin activation/secretion protein